MAKNSFLILKNTSPLHFLSLDSWCIQTLKLAYHFLHLCFQNILSELTLYPLLSSPVYSADPRRPRQAAVQLSARGPLQGGWPPDHPVRGHRRWTEAQISEGTVSPAHVSFRRAAPECSVVQRQHHHWQDLHRQWEGSSAEHPDHPEAGQGRHGPQVQMRGLQHQHEPGPGDLDHPGHHVWVETDLSFDPTQGPGPEGVMEWDAEKFSMLPPSLWARSHDKFIFSSPAGSQDRYWGPAHGVRQRIQPQVCHLGLPPSCRDSLVPETVLRSQGEGHHQHRAAIERMRFQSWFIITRYQERERSFYLLWYYRSGLEIIILSINGLRSNRPSLATFRYYSR